MNMKTINLSKALTTTCLLVFLSFLFTGPLFSQPHPDDDSKLRSFHADLIKSPYVKGVPSDFNKFKSGLMDFEKAFYFYKSVCANPNLKPFTPDSFEKFIDLYSWTDRQVILDFPTEPEPLAPAQYIPVQSFRNTEISNTEIEYQRKIDRIRSEMDAIRMSIDVIGGSFGATIPDYYKTIDDDYQEKDENYSIYKTLPGTSIRDYSRSGYRVEGENIYQTLPGTSIRDYGKSGYKIENGTAYPTLPGTNIRDLSRSGYIIDK